MNKYKAEKSIQADLYELQDLTYKHFQGGLIPNVNPDTVIGVRIPLLRKYAKKQSKSESATLFMDCLPHKYFDENNLHALLINESTDYTSCVAAIEKFLPYVDNWATCDSLAPKIFQSNLSALLESIHIWIKSEHTYTIRFAIEMLMKFYLDERFCPKYLQLVSNVHSQEYYVNMMIAWYFATALAKQYDAALPYLETQCLEVWIHNKTIQKSVESYRITASQKAYLRSLRRK